MGSVEGSVVLDWPDLPPNVNRAYGDMQEATEDGAVGVAIAVIVTKTEYTVVERSAKGPGFDYWLGDPNDEPLFQNKGRLEVSGIQTS